MPKGEYSKTNAICNLTESNFRTNFFYNLYPACNLNEKIHVIVRILENRFSIYLR